MRVSPFKTLLSLLFASTLIMSFAQTQTIRGEVRERDTDAAIPFVHVRVTGTAYGTSTNLDGQFEIKLDLRVMQEQGRTITLSCIGFKSVILQAEEILPFNRLQMAGNTTTLEGVTVSGKKPRKKLRNEGRRLVQRAIQRIPSNYHSKTVLYPSFYRHYCAENDTYVRLIEAAIDVYRHGSSPYRTVYPEKNLEFEVNQLRRSFDFTKSARLSHPPISLNYLLSNDITSYEYHNPLFTKRPISYSLRDTTEYDGVSVAVVDFRAKPISTYAETYDGSLFINLNDLAFIKAEVHERFSRGTISDSVDLHLQKTVFFKQIGRKYYLDRTISDLEALHLTYDTLGQVDDSVVHLSHIELITNNVLLNPSVKVEGGEPTKEDLRRVEYDSLFWKDYTILEATNLEKQIIEDLSARLSLEKQFSMFNEIDKGGKSVLATDQFKALVEKYRGTPTYFVLWADWAYPNYFDMEPTSFLARRIKKDKAQLVMVSLDEYEADWEMARMVYQLDRKGIVHERIDFEFDSEILKQYFRNVLPYRCVFDAEGELMQGAPPLPNDPTVEDYLEPMLQNHSAVETDKLSPPEKQSQN